MKPAVRRGLGYFLWASGALLLALPGAGVIAFGYGEVERPNIPPMVAAIMPLIIAAAVGVTWRYSRELGGSRRWLLRGALIPVIAALVLLDLSYLRL